MSNMIRLTYKPELFSENRNNMCPGNSRGGVLW